MSLLENWRVKAYGDGTNDKEKEEICNQLNRRTEFIVLRTTYGMFDEKGQLKNPPKSKPSTKNSKEEDEGFFVVE